MGAYLAGGALNPAWRKAGLTDPDVLVLTTMALQSLDTVGSSGREPATYHAGHGPLELVLCGVESDAAARKVRRSVRRLLDVGAIELIRPAAWKLKPIYRLRVFGFLDTSKPQPDKENHA